MPRSSVVVVMSVDTEEDNWGLTADRPTVTNIRELPRLHAFLRDLGVRPTYFVNHPVAIDADCAAILSDIVASGTAEIGAHLHPWNTPPIEGPVEECPSMMLHLRPASQAAKVASVTHAIKTACGRTPTSFRAGRFGLGAAGAAVLAAAGYRVDSSVTPYFDWTKFDNGPSFVGAPLDVYRPRADDLCVPASTGSLVEVPISGGYTRGRVRAWNRTYRILHGRIPGRRAWASLAARTGVARHVAMSPEQAPLRDLCGLSRSMLASGLRLIHAFWHSPSLSPGLTPFTRTQQDVDALYDRIGAHVAWLRDRGDVTFATVGEAAELLGRTSVGPEGAAAC